MAAIANTQQLQDQQQQRSSIAAADAAAAAAPPQSWPPAAAAVGGGGNLRFPAFAVTRGGGDIAFTPVTTALLRAVGGYERLLAVTTSFYAKFEADRYLAQFLGGLQVPLECHAARFALYVAEQMGGGAAWTRDTETRPRVPVVLAGGRTAIVASRASAHFCAWNSKERRPDMVGRRFKLDDCRVWMRLMFWAARENGFAADAADAADRAFFDFFVRFIAHFIAIYEGTARVFAVHEAKWSGDAAALARYAAAGRVMPDVINVPYSRAIAQIPPEDVVHDADLYRGAEI